MYKRNLAESVLKLTDHSPCLACVCTWHTLSLCLLKKHQGTKEAPVAFLSYLQGKANEKGSVSHGSTLCLQLCTLGCIRVPKETTYGDNTKDICFSDLSGCCSSKPQCVSNPKTQAQRCLQDYVTWGYRCCVCSAQDLAGSSPEEYGQSPSPWWGQRGGTGCLSPAEAWVFPEESLWCEGTQKPHHHSWTLFGHKACVE